MTFQDVLSGDAQWSVECADNLSWLRSIPSNSVDLVITSPPYEFSRTYGINYNLAGQEFVDWCLPRYIECTRVCRGLTAWVIEGTTEDFQYSAVPILLMAQLHKSGIKLRKPPAFCRVGIPGSGGPDWLRNDYEFIICSTHGKLPWSDNTAMGHKPKYALGGEISHRLIDGIRVNDKRKIFRNSKDGTVKGNHDKNICEIANPGNVIESTYTSEEVFALLRFHGIELSASDIVKCKVGGGHLGSSIAHENEAPFPESLVEFFERSFCPPNGIVLDCHVGSGTVPSVSKRLGRRCISCDLRQSQVDLTMRRMNTVQVELFA